MFSIAICRQSGDKWKSKILFLGVLDLRSSIVLTFSIATYPVCINSRTNIICKIAICLLVLVLYVTVNNFSVMSANSTVKRLDGCPGPQVIKLFSCSSQLRMKFQLLIKNKSLKNTDFSCAQTLGCRILHADKC